MVGIKWKLKLIYSFVLNLTPVARVLSVRLYLEITFFSPFFHELMIKLRQQSFKLITEGCCKVSDSPLTLFFWLLSSSAVLSCSPPTIVRTETNLSWALSTCVKGSELREWAKPSQDSWISVGKQREFFVSFQQRTILISKHTCTHTETDKHTPPNGNYCSKRVRKCSEYFCVCVSDFPWWHTINAQVAAGTPICHISECVLVYVCVCLL